MNLLDIVLILQDRAQRIRDDFGREVDDVKREQAFCPVDGFGHAGFLEQILSPQFLHEGNDFTAECPCHLGRAGLQDRHFAVEVRVVDPVIKAAALQRVMHLARAVGRQDHDGRLGRVDGAKLGDRDLKVRQRFEKESLKRRIGAVEFVDQKDRRTARLGPHCLQ